MSDMKNDLSVSVIGLSLLFVAFMILVLTGLICLGADPVV